MGNTANQWMASLVAVAGMLVSGPAMANHISQHQHVDGMDVYYGIVPAAIAEGRHPTGHPESSLPGGPPTGSYYLVVSLIDSRSGRHISDANISAVVRRGIGHRETLPLPVTTVNHIVSYGNYFTMPRPGTYRIHVSIQRPGASPQTANFSYQQG